MTHADQLARIADALGVVEDVVPSVSAPAGPGTIFVGSGDSLSSGILAEHYGHRAMSSGDLTWTGRLPAATGTVVGISHSGTSGATVRALRLAREAGKRVVAITSNAGSPLAREADELQLVPTLPVEETIPCAGHLMLALGVVAVCGTDTAGATAELAGRIADRLATVQRAVDELPASAPHGVSILTLPDLRGAGDFFMLKLIEATGLPVRTVALEESGHVDYFIGPEAHLSIELIGEYGRARNERLALALESTGQCVQTVELGGSGQTDRDAVLSELAGAAVVTLIAAGASERWGRPPFRGGAVNMDASHIKLGEEPARVA